MVSASFFFSITGKGLKGKALRAARGSRRGQRTCPRGRDLAEGTGSVRCLWKSLPGRPQTPLLIPWPGPCLRTEVFLKSPTGSGVRSFYIPLKRWQCLSRSSGVRRGEVSRSCGVGFAIGPCSHRWHERSLADRTAPDMGSTVDAYENPNASSVC